MVKGFGFPVGITVGLKPFRRQEAGGRRQKAGRTHV
jgi:hypothetical protein